MRYADQPLTKLLEDLSARTPVPGGGSGCAASAAIGAALGAMVAAFSPPKGADPKKDPEKAAAEAPARAAAEARVLALASRLAAARDRFAALVDEDAAAYDGIRAARKAKAPPEEVQQAVVRAMEVPLGGARACLDTLQLLLDLCPDANPRLATDLACGALLLESTLAGMAFNVRVNLLDIKRDDTVAAARAELDRLGRSAVELRRAVLRHVEAQMEG